jgi:hypothetical protein
MYNQRNCNIIFNTVSVEGGVLFRIVLTLTIFSKLHILKPKQMCPFTTEIKPG